MTSLHQRIFDDIEGKIMSGAWSPGQRIPAEHVLEVDYGCSRMTVSKALSALAARGMIVRRRRAGSFVASPQIDRTVMDISDIGTEATRAGRAYGHRILSRTLGRLQAAEAQGIGEKVGAEVLRIDCLHIVDETPNALEKRLILLDAVPQARSENFETNPPGKWLLDQVPWSEAKHIIRAVLADTATSKLLGIERGAACLVLSRQTWQNGRTVTSVQITHPGDRYQFAGVFHPSK